MKNSIFIVVCLVVVCLVILATMLNACNNSPNTTANATDTLSKDSVNVSKDNTAIPKDSGTAASTFPVDTADKAFIIKAASGGMLEIDLGDLSQEKGVLASVKSFGSMMVKDHTDANTNLKNIAKQLQVALPDSLLANHAHHKMELSGKKGAAFDKAYMKMMVEDHKEDIADFEKASKSNNSLIKNFAIQTLPVLNKHLDSAKAIVKTTKL